MEIDLHCAKDLLREGLESVREKHRGNSWDPSCSATLKWNGLNQHVLVQSCSDPAGFSASHHYSFLDDKHLNVSQPTIRRFDLKGQMALNFMGFHVKSGLGGTVLSF